MREKNVLKYYTLCNKLKYLIRTGWRDWNVKKERLESVAEHVYGVQMLAIAMNSEFDYDIDIQKVVLMLAIHELEEIYIGDLTRFQISKEEKNKLGHEAVEKTLDGLNDKMNLKEIILEFDERKTKEAKFAYFCDKLECDLQCKLYDEKGCVDLNDQKNNKSFNDPEVKKLIQEGRSWSEMWLEYGQKSYEYDENFKAVSDFAKDNKLYDLL